MLVRSLPNKAEMVGWFMMYCTWLPHTSSQTGLKMASFTATFAQLSNIEFEQTRP